MLQISKAKKAVSGAKYYLNYYLRDTNGHAHWFGKGAILLEVQGRIVQSEFRNLIQGFSFDGKYSHVKNAGESNRVGFWDLVFSVPKSVSVVWASASKEQREAIDQLIHEALLMTLDYIERTYGLSRQGAGGLEWVPAKLTFALFRHITSREDQPQMHWHCLLINLGVKQDGTIGTLQTKPLFEAKMSLGALFRDYLAQNLTADLGVKIQQRKNDFHIEGVPHELCEINSQRRKQIEDYLEERGLSGAVAAKVAAENTRAPKTHRSQEELFEKWRETAERAGWSEEKANELLGATITKKNDHFQISQSPRVSELKREELSQGHCGWAMNLDDYAKRRALKESLRVVKGGKDRASSANPFQKSPDELRFAAEPSFIKPPAPNALKAFKLELRQATERLFPAKQTRKTIEKMAFAIGKKHGVGARMILGAVDELKLPIHKALYRVEWKPVFPCAPKWSPVHGLQTPRVVLRSKPRKWNKIYYSKPLPAIGGPTVEIRVQQRLLFPKAPQWNPASKLSLPALHFGHFRPHAEEARKREKDRKELQRITQAGKKRHQQT